VGGTKRDYALIKHGHDLSELDDVNLTGAVDDSLIQYNSSTGEWEDITLASLNGQIDHGLLAGLADNDHPQYARLAIAETITQSWTWTDSDEVRLGTGNDLRLYHDGTNSLIDNDTGQLVVTSASGVSIGNTWPTALVTGSYAGNGNLLLRGAAQPNFLVSEDDAGTDEKYWRYVWSGGDWFIQLLDDTGLVPTTFIRMIRTGITSANLSIPLDNAEITLGIGTDLRLYHDGTNSYVRNETGELILSIDGARSVAVAADESLRIGNRVSAAVTNIADPAIYSASGSGSGDYASAGTLFIQPRSSAARDIVIMAGTTSPVERMRIVGASALVRMAADNLELQIGAGQDLRFYHDGTDSFLRNDTGILKINQGTSGAIWVNSSRAIGFNGANYGSTGDVLVSQGSASPPVWSSSAGGGSMIFVAEQVVAGAAATSITVSGLDIDTDEKYVLEVHVDNGTGSTALVSLYFNADTTAGNYRRFTTTGAAATNASTAEMDGFFAGECGNYEISVRRDFDGNARAMWTLSRATGANMWRSGSVYWTTVANITSITIQSSVASAFSIGSRVRVWKVLS
jgi:hypothetical protein